MTQGILNIRGNTLSIPEAGAVYINPSLSEIYGMNVGDSIIADIAGRNMPLPLPILRLMQNQRVFI